MQHTRYKVSITNTWKYLLMIVGATPTAIIVIIIPYYCYYYYYIQNPPKIVAVSNPAKVRSGTGG